MFTRIATIALNTYREAVRARILYGLLACALAATAYSLVVGTLSLHHEARVVADVGAASMSFFSIAVAIVLGATSLHRELELKTIFPILTRRLYRHEYLVGKYLGTLATLSAFVCLDGALVLAILAGQTKQPTATILGTLGGASVVLALGLWRAKYSRVFVLLPWSWALFAVMALVAGPAEGERQLVLASAALTLCEVAIVSGIATVFSSFSSPFLTSIFTLGVWLVGRSADTLGHLPARTFGQQAATAGRVLARIVPNLQAYVPPRALLLGQVSDQPTWTFVGLAAANALFYAILLVVAGALVFRKRDFQ
jgi:ABC-type transport system involved in multi-copper enzyme maturation permease subunit